MAGKAAIYVRVSTKDQRVDGQIERLQKYAEARGFEVFGEYVDAGVSGSASRRPALLQDVEGV